VDGSDDNQADLLHREYSRYEGYWHGFTFIIFDGENPSGAWIRSTRWVPVSLGVDDPDLDTGEDTD